MLVKKGEHIIAKNVKKTSNFIQRCLGLMFSQDMYGFDGLLLYPCKSIHTFFMFYPIDVVFLNGDMKIVGILRNMKPWRITKIYFNAQQVLELKGGTLPDNISLEDTLEVICTN